SLVLDGGSGDDPVPWEESPVPPEHQIRGLGPITMNVPELAATDALLREVMNLRPVREYEDPDHPEHTVVVYEMGEPERVGPHAELHVAVRPDLPAARPGAGGVHHVAFRTPNSESYEYWTRRLVEFGVPNSGQ